MLATRISFLPMLLLLPIAVAAAGKSGTAQHLDHNLDVVCEQMQQQVLCDLRPMATQMAVPVPAIEVEGTSLPIQAMEKFADATAPHSAILFLVDSSDPRRKAIVERIAGQVRAMVMAANSGTLLGLAAFDKGLRLLAAPDADRQAVIAASHQLSAKGKVTELYRSTGEAIDILLEIPVQRRAIYIFSDGLAEDTAYDLESTVAKAKRNRILIYGFGYARTVSAAVGLQTLRRLSEESGGLFIEAGLDASLPEGVVGEAVQYILAGNTSTWDLSHISATPGDKNSSAEIRLDFSNKSIIMNLPLHMEDRIAPIAESVSVEEEPVTIVVSVPAVDEKIEEVQKASRDTLLLMSGSVLVLILVLVLFANRFLRERSSRQGVLPIVPELPTKAYAYMQNISDNTEAVPITCSPWRIGRSINNDYTIDDASISRNHAEIMYLGSNKFKISDLGSSNGLLLNDKSIESAELRPGDVLDLGEIRLKLLLHPEDDDADQEATQFVQTSMSPEQE